MRKVKVSVLVAPTVSGRSAFVAQGYAPSENARFAVVRASAAAPWLLVHRRSGGMVNSALPPLIRKITATDMLTVAAAWDAAPALDWSAFDALPEVTPETTEPPMFSKLDAGQVHTKQRMRDLAGVAIAGGLADWTRRAAKAEG